MFSMGGRNVMPGDMTQKPGPGRYSPEKVCLLLEYISLIVKIFNM